MNVIFIYNQYLGNLSPGNQGYYTFKHLANAKMSPTCTPTSSRKNKR